MSAAGAGAGSSEDETGPTVVDYPNGSPAFRFTKDGAGFVYYPTDGPASGEQPRVAVCVSKVNSYQNKYFFYDNSSQTERYAGKTFQIPKTLLCSVDERVVGHAVCKERRNKPGVIRALFMSQDGGTIVDGKNNVLNKWLWDPSRQNAGTPPSNPIEFRLNKFMRFKFVDRKTITVEYHCDALKMEFSCGEKLRREDTYLTSSTAVQVGALRGKRNITMDTPSLIQRQQDFFEAMRHKTILLYPDSNRIRHPELRGVMAGLEDHFAPYERKIAENEYSTTPYPTAGWKEEALAQTLAEVPQFGRTKTDLGETLPASFQADPVTLGETMKLQGNATQPMGATFNSTMRSSGSGLFGQTGGLSGVAQEGGKWLGELDVRKRLEERHPALKRSMHMKNASGRYAVDLEVEGKPPAFKKLPVVSAAQFDDFIRNVVPPDQLVMVACLREDDPACRTACQLLEHVNGTLSQSFTASSQRGMAGCPYRVVKFDMASSRFLVKRFGIRSLPMYLMFLNSKLVYAGTLGGAKVRMPRLDLKANYLLLEPDARSQLVTEKVLRKLRVDWDLACTVSNAMAQTKRLAENMAKSGPKRRYGALATGHAVIMSSCDLTTSQLKPLMQTLQRRGRGAPAVTVCGGAKLLGDSLVAITHPIGTVLPAKSMCAMCMAAVEAKKGKTVEPESLVATADERAGAGFQPWLCPRCSLVQNPTPDLLCGTFGSVAVVKPPKPATCVTLAKLWTMLQAAKAKERSKRASGRPKGSGPSVDAMLQTGEGIDEAAHLGLTHDEVLKELKVNLEAGKRGKFLPAGFKFGLSLSSQDTLYKGVRLRRADN